MATVWIVTTGNSDVRLDSNASKAFNTLKDDPKKPEKREALGVCHTKFRPEKCKIKEGEFSLEARVLGIIYGDAIATHRSYFKFNLLDGFCNEIEKNNKPYRIITLLTDQEAIFLPNHENILYNRSDSDSPYWKDTCILEPIFEHYFQGKYGIKIEPVYLKPEAGQIGLDDWNVTLKLVQDKFSGLGIKQDDLVIVSHQAGTPAISSAVQFASLSMFGNKVRFLTSNERTGVASLDPSSSYFESMQIQEAQKLLKSYDYVGVENVLGNMLKETDRDVAKNILILLEVAKLWNLSKFRKLKAKLQDLETDNLNLRNLAIERVADSNWWWSAYEEAYLAIVRYRQENFVEAFFHSYRAVEGMFCEWGKAEFKTHIILKEEHSATSKKKNSLETGLDRPYLQTSILDDSKNYFKDAANDKYAEKLQSMFEKLREESKEVVLYGAILYDLFKVCRKNYKSICKDITKFWDGNNGIEGNRNKVFHQLHGLTELELFAVWDVKTEREWEIRIKDYLNLVSDQRFQTLEEASLMARVHEELVKEIGAIANKSTI